VSRGKSPLVEPSLLTKPAFTAGIAGMALFFSALIGTQLALTLFLQLGQGFSAGQAGLAALPLALGTFAGSALAGAVLLDRLGRRVLQLGAVLQIAADGWVLAVLLTSGFSLRQLVPALALLGAGGGLIIASLITIVVGATADHEAGSGAGLLAAVQSIAAAAGIALFGGLLFARLAAGNAASGFELALGLQGVLLTGFLATSFFLPAQARAAYAP